MANADEARDKLDKILSQKEYQVYYEDNRNFLEVAWDQLKAWVTDLLSQMFSSLEPSNALGNMIVSLLMVVVVILLAITIWLVVRSAGRKRKFSSRPPLESGSELTWSWHNHLTKANDVSDQGHYAEATRHVFLALLLYFDEIDWLEARSWKTNWEYFAELRRVDKEGAEAFQRLALIFDQVFYGEQSMTRADYERYRQEADQWLKQERPQQTAEN